VQETEKFCAALQKNCRAAHEQGVLSRGPEGEEFRAAGAGGKNGGLASSSGEHQSMNNCDVARIAASTNPNQPR